MTSKRDWTAFALSIVFHGALAALAVVSTVKNSAESESVTVQISDIEIKARESSTAIAKNPTQVSENSDSVSQPTNQAPASAGAQVSAASAEPSSQVVGSYLSQIREKISRSIHPPRARLFSTLKATLRLTLLDTGKVKENFIEQSSGVPDFDRDILAALEKSQPFPPFTREMSAIHEVTLKIPIEVRVH